MGTRSKTGFKSFAHHRLGNCLKELSRLIRTYSEYIGRYIRKLGLAGNKLPGEHHFVSVYLVPLLYRLTKKVPDYVNPDGTKKLIGDVIYFESGHHRLGIEVKLGTVRLTPTEFNNWIVKEDRAAWPNVFLGVGSGGMLLLSWDTFRNSYIRSVGINRNQWILSPINNGYGPMKSVDLLCQNHASEGFFKYSADDRESVELEESFSDALSELMTGDS